MTSDAEQRSELDELDELDRLEGPAEGAWSVLRRGLADSPALRNGLWLTVVLGVALALGRLVIPVLIQRVLDRALDAESDVAGAGSGVDTGFLLANAGVAALLVVGSACLSWVAQRRLVVRAEAAITSLRTRAFAHVHRLSVADHNDTKRGILVARVTSDADALARFAQWGLYAWTIEPILLIGTFAVLTWYSWQLALLVAVVYCPVILVLRRIQRRQVVVYDHFRTTAGEMVAAFSETLMGSSVIRSYGAEGRARGLIGRSLDRRYRARMAATKYMSFVFVIGDLFGVVAFSSVLVVGLINREAWGLGAGELVASLILVTLLNEPIAHLGETLDQVQLAIAGWRKILHLLDQEVEVGEPEPGRGLAPEPGPLPIGVDRVGFAYRRSEPVLIDVSVDIEAGSRVAIVGETGSGKTTFAKLLCRLADPTEGTITVGGLPLTGLSPEARNRAIRMVPQDGFLFDATVGTNVGYGRDGADDRDAAAAFTALGLDWWVDKLPRGLDTEVGERGENLSVGERQLVALARAQLADPGVLILDEATSAVDPETDQALTVALRRLARGRTMVSVAHRLATAETADLVLVFDRGRLVERGPHEVLVEQGGIYAGLHRAWVGNTRLREATAD